MIEDYMKIGFAILGIGLPLVFIVACIKGVFEDHKR
jgi:hypothetical protein